MGLTHLAAAVTDAEEADLVGRVGAPVMETQEAQKLGQHPHPPRPGLVRPTPETTPADRPRATRNDPMIGTRRPPDSGPLRPAAYDGAPPVGGSASRFWSEELHASAAGTGAGGRSGLLGLVDAGLVLGRRLELGAEERSESGSQQPHGEPQ